MTIAFVGAGTFTSNIYTTAATPPIPPGVISGDLLICVSYFRGDGTLASTWATHAFFNASQTYLIISYRVATGSDTAPTITPSGGVATQHHSSCVFAFRGCDPITPFGTPGTIAQYASAEDIGPIAAATAVAANGAVIVASGRNDQDGGATPTIANLTGDGLTWVSTVDASSGTAQPARLKVNHAIWSGAAPTLTAKTYDVQAGAGAGNSAGVMLLLNPSVANISYVGAGAVAIAAGNAASTPAIPSGIAANDLLIAFNFLRSPAGSTSISSGWTTLATIANGSTFHRVYYRIATGGDAAPTITPTGSISSQFHMTRIVAFRGCDTANPFGAVPTFSYSAGPNIGPIPAATAINSVGGVIVWGARPETATGATAGVLSGDGVTWNEIFDDEHTGTNPIGAFVADYALWSGGPPTLTAKTFTVTGGTSSYAVGRMYLINAAPATAVTFVGITDDQSGDHTTVLSVGLPPGITTNDLMLLVGYRQQAGTLSISTGGTGWVQHSLLNSVQNGVPFYLQTWYRWVDGTQSSTLNVSVTGGQTTPQTVTNAFCMAFRGVNRTTPFGTDGADSFNAAAQNVGPIAAPSGLPSGGAAIVLGAKAALWTGTATLSGDGLTWGSALSYVYTTQVGASSCSVVANYGTWLGSIPSITSKTFVPTGTTVNAAGVGKMLVLNAIDAAGLIPKSLNTAADTSVAVSRTVATGLDTSVIISGNVWAGESAGGFHTSTLSPPMPAGAISNDVLILFAYLRNSGTLDLVDEPWPLPVGTIFVSPTGNDTTGNGSAGAPYLTIQKAATMVAAGSVVHVLPGTYNAYGMVINTSGTANSRITFISTVKWGAKLRPALDITEGSVGYPQNHIFYLNGSYIDIIGFDIAPAGGGVTLIQNGIGVAGNNCTVRACKLVDINIVSSWVGSALPVTGYSNVIDSNVIFHIGNSALDHGIYQWGGINTIINNLIGRITGFGVSLWHAVESTFIHGNTVFNCGEGGILVASGESAVMLTDGVISNNIVYNNGTYGIQESSGESVGCQYINNIGFGNAIATMYLYTGTGSGTLTANPLFVNYQSDGSGDYHLATGSPAINSGSTTYSPSFDISGKRRSSTAPSRGAYEYYNPGHAWTAQPVLVDETQFGTRFYAKAWSCIHDGLNPPPTIAVSGGAASPQTVAISTIIAARGLNPQFPIGVSGANSFNNTAANIGPIAPPVGIPSTGSVLVFGIKNAAIWTSKPTLSGDGLTWTELFDAYTTSTGGVSATVCCDTASWLTGAPTLTAKTFTPTGGPDGTAMGKMIILNSAAIATLSKITSLDTYVITSPSIRTVTTSADVVARTATSRIVGLDANVIGPTTHTLASSADVYVLPANVFISLVTFFDAVVTPTPTFNQVMTSVQEMSAQHTDTAWLVLITLSHDELQFPIRVTSDAVTTTSRGNNFSPFPFSIILPDDVEGKPPQAELKIDNTTQEIIAAIRGLVTPPTLTVEIVRSTNTDVVEFGWTGLKWTSSLYDKEYITGVLTVDDLAKEEFPYITFDSRWRGLFN